MEAALEIELEALSATYADDVAIDGPSSGVEYPVTIMFKLAPRGVDSHDAFVAGTLRLHLPSSYPEASPHIELLDTKGIGDQRLELLRQRLCEEASTLAGEMALGALCEHALDWITEQNRPEGLCAFCLCAMRPGPAPDAAAPAQAQAAAHEQPLVRLPCFHAFHRDCYTGWWGWLQQSLEARERELVKHTGASAASVLREQDLPARDPHGVYETSCPVCRAPAPLDCLGPQLRDELVAAAAAAATASAPSCCGDGRGGAGPPEHKAPRGGAQQRNGQGRQPHQEQQHRRGPRGQGWQENNGAEAEVEAEAPRHRLSAAELGAYREVQARHARVLARQRAAGGLIEQACYSIAGWTLGQEEQQQPQGPGRMGGEEAAPREAGQQVPTLPPPQQQQQQQQQQRQQQRRAEPGQQRHKGGGSAGGLNGGGGGGGGGGRNALPGPGRTPCVLAAATGFPQSEQAGSGHDGPSSGPREQGRGRGGGRQQQQQRERQEGNQRRPGTGQLPPGAPVEAAGGAEVSGSSAGARRPETQGPADAAAAAAVVASALRGVCGKPGGDTAPATGAGAGGGRNRGGGGGIAAGGGGRGGGGGAGADGPRGGHRHRPSSASTGSGPPPAGASPTAAASAAAPSCGGGEAGPRTARGQQAQSQQRPQRVKAELGSSGGADLGSGGDAAGGRSEAGGGGRGGGPGRRARQQQVQGTGPRPRGEPRPSDT